MEGKREIKNNKGDLEPFCKAVIITHGKKTGCSYGQLTVLCRKGLGDCNVCAGSCGL